MKVLILGGFLGSGKTSSLLQLARYIARDAKPTDTNPKVVILENEIGEIGVDDKVLASGGYKVDTLFQGCACCTMSGEVVMNVLKIKEDMNPEWLIIEATGVAYPVKIKETIEEIEGLEVRIAALTDAKRWKRLLIPMKNLIKDQLEGAQTILINKIDLVDEEMLAFVEESVKGFNETAKVFKITTTTDVDTAVWKAVLGEE